MKIAIASDHAAIQLKADVCAWLTENGYEYEDFGSSEDNVLEYTQAAKYVCDSLNTGKAELGVLMCGTGVGVSMAANKTRGIRAACCSDYFTAKYTRMHNNANVLCFGARVVGKGLACELVKVFLETSFEGGRHTARVQHLMDMEKDW